MKTSRKMVLGYGLPILAALIYFVGAPLDRKLSQSQVDRMNAEHPAWLPAVASLALKTAKISSDVARIHAKDDVLAAMPPEVAMVVIEDNDAPALSAKYADAGQYRVFFSSKKESWSSFGTFRYRDGDKWARTLSCWVEPEPGQRFHVVMFLN